MTIEGLIETEYVGVIESVRDGYCHTTVIDQETRKEYERIFSGDRMSLSGIRTGKLFKWTQYQDPKGQNQEEFELIEQEDLTLPKYKELCDMFV